MSSLKKIYTLFCVVLFYCCKPRNELKNIFEAYRISQEMLQGVPHQKYDTIEYSRDSKVYIEYFNKGGVKKINSTVLNNKFGHSFTFNEKEGLEKYYFLIDSVNAKIMIEKEGENFYEKSKILMDYWPYSDTGEKKFSLVISKFPRKQIRAQMSYDGLKYTPLLLKESKLLPLLMETDIRKVGKKIFIKLEASDLALKLNGISPSKYETDTLYFE